MIKKYLPNPWEKEKSGFWLLSPGKPEKLLFWLILFLIPTQLGLHFWPAFSNVSGIRVDYLSPTIFLTDVLIFILLILSFKPFLYFLQNILKTKYVLVFPILIIGAVFAKSPENSFIGILKFIELLFFGHYVYLNFSSKLALSAFVPASLLQSLIAGIQFVLQSSIGGFFYFLGERAFNGQTPGIANASLSGELLMRPYGTLPHPNVLAGYLLLSLLLVAACKKNNLSTGYVVFSLISIFVILLSLSRIAVFLLPLYFLPIIFQVNFKKENIGKLIVPALVLLGFFFFVFSARFLDFSLNQESITTRLTLFKNSISLFANNPLLGVGIKNYLVNLPSVQKEFYLQPVHNIYLLVFSETGVLGISIFIIFLYSTFKKALAKRKTISIFIALLTIGMFDHYLITVQQGQLIFAFYLGLIWSAKL